MSAAADIEYVGRLDSTEARALTDQIKVGVEAVWQLITRAYTERAWAALGYTSWDDYCTREFGTSRLRLPREERQEIVSSLRESGLSLRAIASATGLGRGTVERELSPVPNGTPEVATAFDQVVEDRADVFDRLAEFDSDSAECIHCHRTLPLSKLYEGGQGYECDPCVSPDVPDQELPTDPYENVQAEPMAQPRPVTGIDGKTYNPKPAPQRKPPEPPITKSFSTANFELRKAVERVVRLSENDRFKKNKDQISGSHLSDLVRARDAINSVIQLLEG